MKNPTILDYTYYRCSKKRNTNKYRCPQRSIKSLDLELSMQEFLKAVTINEQYLKWGLKYLEKAKDSKGESRKATLKKHQAALDDANKRLDGLLEMRISKELTETEYATKKEKLEIEKAKHTDLIYKFSESQIKADQQTVKTLTFAESALREYTKGDLKKKREIIGTLGSNLTLLNQILNVKADEPFAVLTEAIKVIPNLQPRFEPAIQRRGKREKRPLEALNPTWLALLRDFRAFDWIKEYKYPTVMLDQMKGLLAKYENV